MRFAHVSNLNVFTVNILVFSESACTVITLFSFINKLFYLLKIINRFKIISVSLTSYNDKPMSVLTDISLISIFFENGCFLRLLIGIAFARNKIIVT